MGQPMPKLFRAGPGSICGPAAVMNDFLTARSVSAKELFRQAAAQGGLLIAEADLANGSVRRHRHADHVP